MHWLAKYLASRVAFSKTVVSFHFILFYLYRIVEKNIVQPGAMKLVL